MKVTVLCDDYWHPGKVPQTGYEALALDLDFEFVYDVSEWDFESIRNMPMLIISKSDNTSQQNKDSWMTPEVTALLTEYVNGGGSLLVTHSGTCYRDNVSFTQLIGGSFHRHPAQCDVTHLPLKDHPITDGFLPFTQKDEHYLMNLLGDTDMFMATDSINGCAPGGWTRKVGEGKVCVLTPGHNVEVWLDPNYQILLGNAVKWCLAK